MPKRTAILEIAAKLFAERGYEGTSVRDIASAAGINLAMVNYYFGSKEKLLEKIVEHKTEYLRNIFTDLINNKELPSIEKIDTVVATMVNRRLDHPSFHHLLYRELTLNDRTELQQRILDILLQNANIIKEIIRQGIRKGEFEPVDVELTVFTVLGSISQLIASPDMCRKMLNKPETFDPYTDKAFRKRVIKHITGLMHCLLIKK
jgi:AcrR family transcriptional regulator